MKLNTQTGKDIKVYGAKNQTRLQKTITHIKRDRQLLIILIPCIIFYILFRYGPMYGLIIAFQKYNVFNGVLGSPWVGIKYFKQFFSSTDFFLLFKNTLLLGMYALIFTFPFPIVFALLLNELKNQKFKKAVQTISFLPSFLSVVVVVSMVMDFLSPTSGAINMLLESMGIPSIYFMIKPEWFRTVYIGSDIYQFTGFSAIIYLAALTGINPSLYEAGRIDGCNRFQAMRYITLPGIYPTIATLFIIRCGNVIKIGFEKVLLLYNPTLYSVADVFSTFVYRKGLEDSNFSYAAAVGLFESAVAFILVIAANYMSRKFSEESIY